MKLQKPKGTQDILPADSAKWQYVENVARETFKKYNYGEIRTPMFEHYEVISRSVGEELALKGSFWLAVLQSLLRIIAGCALGIAAGSILGVLTAMSRVQAYTAILQKKFGFSFVRVTP